MLEPHSRRLLLDALAPPLGYRFDRAIGTTFTLDLLALLTAPLAFSLIDVTEQDGGRPVVDPLALLEAARRHSARISLFTDAGHVAVPKPGQPLFTLLEESVVPVTAPRRGGLFHPKVWLVRYVSEGEPVALRLLCSSRNLTFDRSWDTLLVLDGTVSTEPVAQSEPVAGFVEALPAMAVAPPPARIMQDVAVLADDVRRTRFDAPEGLEIGAFHPMGIDAEQHNLFAGRIDRLMIISPFVAGARLQHLAGRRRTNVLVSRAEELVTIPPEELSGYADVLVLSDFAAPEPREDEADASVEPFPAGLHAKVYVADAGWDARLWTGSANATDQAFGTNVEFMVELHGRRRVCGVNAILAEGSHGVPGMRDLLDDYRMHQALTEPDPDDERRRHLLDAARAVIVRTVMRLRVAPSGTVERYDLHLESVPAIELQLPPEVSVTCRPITLGDGAATELLSRGPRHAVFPNIAVRDLSAFIAVTVALDHAGDAERFTLALPLDGAPAERAAAVLSQLIRDRRDLIRFLLLLLAADETRMSDRLNDLRRLLGSDGDSHDGGGGLPLLEPMLQALVRDPARIDQIARVIDELGASPEGQDRLPEGLDSVWPAILAARKTSRP